MTLRPEQSREGRRIARLFRQSRDLLDVRACNLDEILDEQGLEVAQSEHLEAGYSAYLLRAGRGGGIMVSAGQPAGRRRFSLAHELGHFLIPSHAKKGMDGYCLNADMRARGGDAKQLEWEANDFSAELLMPDRLFRSDVAGLDPSIQSVDRLASAEMYNVSMLAAAWRFIQVSRRPVAVVVSGAGNVSWVVRSEAFTLPLTERGQSVHPNTLAAAVLRGEGAVAKPQLVDAGAWLDHAVPIRGDLYESTYAIESQNQMVSMLWYDEATEDDD